jgi:putative SOS response-associated peptidase YedK
MCGRFTLTATPAEVAEFLLLEDLDGFPPRFNIAPTQPILVVLGGRDVRPEALTDGREGRLVRWGFLPGWLKEPKGAALTFNARSETAAEKPSFRGAMRHRRCLVPASGFYEWRRERTARKGQPYFVRPRSARPIVFAGIMETWHAADGSEIDTAAILTTGANATLSPIHERMPVTIAPRDIARWLDCRAYEPREVADLLVPAGDEIFEAIPVSDLVNKVAHVGPEVQAPLGAVAISGSGRAPAPAQGSLF